MRFFTAAGGRCPARLGRHEAVPPALRPAELERLWGELATADPAAADETMWRLASAGDAAAGE